METGWETRIPPPGVVPRPGEARRVSLRPWPTEDAACTGGRVPDRVPPKGWRGRAVLAGNMGSILPSPEPSKSGRVSC